MPHLTKEDTIKQELRDRHRAEMEVRDSAIRNLTAELAANTAELAALRKARNSEAFPVALALLVGAVMDGMEKRTRFYAIDGANLLDSVGYDHSSTLRGERDALLAESQERLELIQELTAEVEYLMDENGDMQRQIRGLPELPDYEAGEAL